MDRQRETNRLQHLSRAIAIVAVAAALNLIPAYAQNNTPPAAGPAPGSGLGQGAMPPFGGIGPGRGPGAGRGMGRNMPSFSEFDLNGDGSITEQELDQARANRIKERSQQGYPMRNLANAASFKSMDLNGDGRITAQEFSTAQAQHRQQMMQ
jgi:hypothetical protein